MMWKQTIGILFVVLSLAVVGRGEDGIILTADVPDGVLEAEFAAGDVVPVTFSVSSETGAGVFGVEFEMATNEDDLLIRSISFDPAFSEVMGGPEPALPADRFKTVRVQLLNNIDRALGAGGTPVPFATVEIEMTRGTFQESALEVKARGALLGEVPKETAVLDAESTTHSGRRGRNQLTFVNTSAAADPDSSTAPAADESLETSLATDPEPWTCVEADVSIEVRPVGGGDPVTVLAPDTTYELHYQAGYDRVNAYVLFAVATSANQGFADATPPAAGDWSAAGDFGFVDIEAELSGLASPHGYPEGYFRYYMAYDDFWPGTDNYAGSQGHLCNFTTQSAGELNLELYICWLDNDQFESAEMYTQAQYVVEEPGAADQ